MPTDQDLELRKQEDVDKQYAELDLPTNVKNIINGTKFLTSKKTSQQNIDDLEEYYNSTAENAETVFIAAALARYYEQMAKNKSKALIWWEKIKNVGEYREEALISLGDCYSSESNLAKAREVLEQALEESEEGAVREKVENRIKLLERAEQVMGVLKSIDDLIEKDKLEEAIVKCDELLNLVPASKTAHFKKAQIYGKQRKPVEAKKEFNLAK